jgi:hypothetical protein
MSIFIPWLISLILFATTIYFFQFANQVKRRLKDGAAGYDLLSKHFEHGKAKISALESQLVGLTTDLKKAEASRNEASARAAAADSELLHVKSMLERKLANAELQRDHVLARYESLQGETDQLRATLVDTRTHLDQQMKFAAESQRSGAVAHKNELADIHQKLTLTQRELTTARSQKTIDPKEYETARRRAAQNEQLYQSMKSLRDMAEERNRNWETALKVLATWILSSSHLARPQDPALAKPIGPLVGEALARVGGSLLNVDAAEELHSEQQTIAAAEL